MKLSIKGCVTKAAMWILALSALPVSHIAWAANHAQHESQLTTAGQLNPGMRPQGVPVDYVVTPNGYFAASCVQTLRNGESVEQDGNIRKADGSLRKIARCTQPHYTKHGLRIEPDGSVSSGGQAVPPPTINGWIESADYSSSTAIGEIDATWVVPSAPSSWTGQVDYFFPGAEQSTSSPQSILQPVLGFNGYGDNAWTIASWNCCVSGTTYHSSPVNVSAGDTIVGQTYSNCGAWPGCQSWNIVTWDQTSNQSTTLTTNPYDNLYWVFAGVLEAYGIDDCSKLPSSGETTFYNVAVYDTNYNPVSSTPWANNYWSGSTSPSCGYRVYNNATTAWLYY